MVSYQVHAIKNHGGTGEERFYLYAHYREGRRVISKYIRPAANKKDKIP